MSEHKYVDKATGTETVGHEWDGIVELDTPMPRWWVWTFYATIVWGIAYMILYPAWPLVNSATEGVLGWTSRGELQKEMSAREQQLEPIRAALVANDINSVAANENLRNQAINGGASAFKVHCVQCHGSGASGFKGYPNLNDDDWLWGGDLEAIEYTLVHGIRQPDHPDTRFSQMPAFGRDGILQPNEIQDVVSYVRTISGDERPSPASERGAVLYEANCTICHGADGKGDRFQGAPNLTDRIALYGRDRASLTETITNSRYGVMPRWSERLDPATIRMLAIYVHSLGGGEAAPQPDETAETGTGDEQS
ncbi:cytochrome c oxidase cbb3-type subunit 3 [Parasphingorhabdus marina DSM 22363]|uniref:Cbb3-type cytochrome c oxidase subunit n=1 Tax=Parasphingorhabdus marina DSM 22363 TaxID=1123272 RepID=A0A1N6HIY4_9SPHN|nr:cytochrome-c oxidase, cbb3-type subunit III [Parasphingorhabdus marina]SIO19703.1 cytochrome c oxidase cbb3-type subunit 3 [Parasphingorhabdus marina DSM 22363]